MERNIGPTSRGTPPKIRKMSVPFAQPPGISGIFGRMESAVTLTYSMSGGWISAKKELK